MKGIVCLPKDMRSEQHVAVAACRPDGDLWTLFLLAVSPRGRAEALAIAQQQLDELKKGQT
jgi:hypothetical protein